MNYYSMMNQFSNPCISGTTTYTEKRSRFMKWLGKIFGGGSGSVLGARGRRPQQFFDGGDDDVLHHSPAAKPQAKREKEDLDHAMALSLAEDLESPNEYKWKTDIDDDLTRMLQDDLNPFSYPHHTPKHSSEGYRFCAGCNFEIGHGNYLSCMGAFFHPECFCCHQCGVPITEHEFSLSGKWAFHKSCFKEITHPKCEVCHQFIPKNRAGLIEYRCHTFWSQKYCPSHEQDGTARCCSCERLECWNTRFIGLDDGRNLCLECMESAIMDTGDCQPLYHTIRDYYEGLNMKLEQQIPMLLVERQALNEAFICEKNGYLHMPETRGLCLSEEQTVPSIHRKSKMGGGKIPGMRRQQQKLTRRCEVTAILVLYGLPRLLTGSILAHELMHGWLRLKGYRNLKSEVEEGICQVLSHMWLESEVLSKEKCTAAAVSASSSSQQPPPQPSSSSKKGRRSATEMRLGEFFLHQIMNDSSTAYGGGFRSANMAVAKYGLWVTLNHIRLTGHFPL